MNKISPLEFELAKGQINYSIEISQTLKKLRMDSYYRVTTVFKK